MNDGCYLHLIWSIEYQHRDRYIFLLDRVSHSDVYKMLCLFVIYIRGTLYQGYYVGAQ